MIMEQGAKLYRYLLMTLDPVHIGTGGYRLGRVDLTIVREPGTNIPKIPGTALHGAIRSYAAYYLAEKTNDEDKIKCAGQGGVAGREHCGSCPICYTFGYSKGDEQSYSGIVNIGDARIAFFPVYSMYGPVWVTSVGVLKELGVSAEFDVNEDKAQPLFASDKKYINKYINFGWLMMELSNNPAPSVEFEKVPQEVTNNAYVLSDKLFSIVVNSNLEVRTSVSINPLTGAAESGALFTYEAIPRATVLWMDVVVDDFRKEFPKDQGFNDVLDVINKGLSLAELLGIGGMGTRGFGRIKKLG